jgi:ribosomal protection tetracycline resistance protein
MKKITLGILAHVDSGKTTLSEAFLYATGKIRKLGRVDHKDAFLDNFDLEKQRGITIFSKQAELEYADTKITLLDTGTCGLFCRNGKNFTGFGLRGFGCKRK